MTLPQNEVVICKVYPKLWHKSVDIKNKYLFKLKVIIENNSTENEIRLTIKLGSEVNGYNESRQIGINHAFY